jgi:Protein of unknown function (DUF4058)
MKSPFLGMDPYVETCGLWEDFHDDLISEMKRALAAATPERYLVRTGERSYIVLAEPNGKESHFFVPDVGVTAPPSGAAQPAGATTAVAGVAAPVEAATETEAVTLRAFVATRFRETFVEIYEATPEQRLVTCVEVLSPSNKRRGTEGWELYLRKRQALLMGTANLVEIDLLRGGSRLPMLDPWPNSPYTLLVCRQDRAPYCQVWPAHFQRPLPTIPVPLASPDPDVPLALQPMIEAIYARARYGRSIDYARPAAPPLSAQEQAWLTERLAARKTAGS